MTLPHHDCNRQAGLKFLGVSLVLGLVASDEKFSVAGRGPPHPYPLLSLCLTTDRHLGWETLKRCIYSCALLIWQAIHDGA